MGQAGPSFGQVPFRERGRWSSAPSDCRAAALGQADGRRPCPVGRAVGWREATGWRSTQGYSEQQFSDFSEAGRRAYRPRHQRHRPQPRKGVKRRELHICVLRRDGLRGPHAASDDDKSRKNFESFLIRDCWVKVEWGYGRILVRDGANAGWINYMLKDRQKSEFDGFVDCVIIESLHNPIADA